MGLRLGWIVLCLFVGASLVRADGVYVPKLAPSGPAGDVAEPTQKAIVTYLDGRERLVLQVSYRGRTSEFVWLVPTPSRPKVTECRPIVKAFDRATAPRLKYWLDADWLVFRLQGLAGAHQPKLAEPLKVDVLERKQVGPYDVSVLQAEDEGDLLAWLRKDGYLVNDGLAPVLGDYIHRGWVFTAARVKIAGRTAVEKTQEGTLQPLQLEFAALEPVYPLKISSLNPGRTKLLIYTVAKHRLTAPGLRTTCVMRPRTMEGMALLRPALYRAMEGWDDDSSEFTNLYVTRLTANLTSSRMTDDLVFRRSASDKTIPPPDVSPPFLENLGAVLVFFMAIPFAIPFSLLTFFLILAVGASPLGKSWRWRWWLILGLAVLLASALYGFPVIGLSQIGYWPVGLAAVLAIPAGAVWVWRKRKRRKPMLVRP